KIRQLLEATLTKNNFQPLIFPTYEYAELFNTSLGSATDIIHKEMFTFPDRKGRNLALRPEGTVGVARLILQNRLFAAGVELVNAAGVRADYQILKLVQDIFAALGINQFTCNLNYLGSKSTQEKYKLELRKFLAATTPDLCDDCRRRAEENPLRILDYHDYWQELQQILTRFNFPYQVNHHLVRGLDYYTGLVFEIDLGEEKAVLGGGRYDQLFQQLGGIALPAAGFAIGIDRRILAVLTGIEPVSSARQAEIITTIPQDLTLSFRQSENTKAKILILVPKAGFAPARRNLHEILSLACLLFHAFGQYYKINFWEASESSVPNKRVSVVFQ
ncbi:18778_t:CDS:2, partial [Racocetra persica]